MLRKDDILNAIKYNDLNNRIISLHSSYKSFGGVSGGPETIIDCFLECGCTLLVPTFTYCYQSYPSDAVINYKQNAIELSDFDTDSKIFKTGFSKDNNDITRIMGIIPKLILERVDSVRGNHPINSLTAIGPKAEKLIESQNYLNVYGPYKECYKDSEAIILLMGTDFTSATPIHYAEQVAGRKLFRRNAFCQQGSKVEVEVGSCSNGFNSLIPVVKDIRKISSVGESKWQIYNFKSFIELLASEIILNSNITKCSDSSCIRCRDAALGGPLI